MDDRTTMHGPPGGRAVIRRRCEATRFQQELLARAYQHIACEARRTLINPAQGQGQGQGQKVASSLTARRLLARGA